MLYHILFKRYIDVDFFKTVMADVTFSLEILFESVTCINSTRCHVDADDVPTNSGWQSQMQRTLVSSHSSIEVLGMESSLSRISTTES